MRCRRGKFTLNRIGRPAIAKPCGERSDDGGRRHWGVRTGRPAQDFGESSQRVDEQRLEKTREAAGRIWRGMMMDVGSAPLRERKRARPATCLADVADLSNPASIFEGEMPAAEPGRALLRKWWEWDYLADCAEKLDLLRADKRGIGLGVGTEPLIYFFGRHCGQIVATDLYSADTPWAAARLVNFRESVLLASPFPLPPGRVLVENADMRCLPVGEASQDFAWSTSSVEHVPTLSSLLAVYAELARVLAPGGFALITTEFCLSGAPYPLSHLNAMDSRILERLFGGLQPWFEPVGPLDLSFDSASPANGSGARRYPKPGEALSAHDARFDVIRIGHVIVPLGISAVCPVGFVLRRTAAPLGAFPKIAELGLPENIVAYTKGLDLFGAGRNEEAAGELLPIAFDPAGPLQLRVHALRFGIDARLRADQDFEGAAGSILDFLEGVPPHVLEDADCSDLFSHVLRGAGHLAAAASAAREGALSASTLWEHAVRLAARSDALTQCKEELLAGVASDLILAGRPPGAVLEQCHRAGEAEGMSAAMLDRTIAQICSRAVSRSSFGRTPPDPTDESAALREETAKLRKETRCLQQAVEGLAAALREERGFREQVGALEKRTRALEEDGERLRQQGVRLREENEGLKEQTALLQRGNEAFRNSTSWRVTAPLRALGSALGRGRSPREKGGA